MKLWFLRKKSAGIAVNPVVHRLISRGNRDRDKQHYEAAAQAYRDALSQAPELRHIWIQLGHVLKEIQRLDEAEVAYREAANIVSDDPDPYLHLGYLAQRQGRDSQAARYFLQVLMLDPGNIEASGQLRHLLEGHANISLVDLIPVVQAHPEKQGGSQGSFPGVLQEAVTAVSLVAQKMTDVDDQKTIQKALQLLGGLHEESVAKGAAAEGPIAVDISALVYAWLQDGSRTPLQHRQFRLLHAIARLSDRPVVICCLSYVGVGWSKIPASIHDLLSRGLHSGDQAAWKAALHRLRLYLFVAEPMNFQPGSCLVNIAPALGVGNYFLALRNIQRAQDVRSLFLIEDLTPFMAAREAGRAGCVAAEWMIGALRYADAFLLPSPAAKDDLLRIAEDLGEAPRPDSMSVARFDGDDDRAEEGAGSEAAPFILMVSAVASGRDQIMALDAWSALVERHGIDAVPRLVIVGPGDWLSGAVRQRIIESRTLSSLVSIRTDLPAGELSALYRSSLCLLQPGISELSAACIRRGLAAGKVVIASEAFSEDDISGKLVVKVPIGSVTAVSDAVGRLIVDAPYRRRLEALVAAEYAPARWFDTVAKLDDIVARLERDARQLPLPSSARLGVWYPTSACDADILAGRRYDGGERFRHGAGWAVPDDDGCWTKAIGAELVITPLGTEGARLRLYLELRGLEAHDSRYTIKIGTGEVRQGVVKARARKWVALDIAAADPIRLFIQGAHEERVNITAAGALFSEYVSVGLRGFCLIAADDMVARSRLLEAISFGDIYQQN